MNPKYVTVKNTARKKNTQDGNSIGFYLKKNRLEDFLIARIDRKKDKKKRETA